MKKIIIGIMFLSIIILTGCESHINLTVEEQVRQIKICKDEGLSFYIQENRMGVPIRVICTKISQP